MLINYMLEKVIKKNVKENDKLLIISEDQNINNYISEQFDVVLLIYQSLDSIIKFINNISQNKKIILKVKKDFDFKSLINSFNWLNLDIYNQKSEDEYIIVTYL